MKAVVLHRNGPPEMLSYEDAPDPQAAPGEIVVDVVAASVNGADYKVRQGGGSSGGPSALTFPYILGRDFSGVVAKTGPGVTEFAPGDPVFGVLDRGKEGTYAEKLAVAAAIVARKPDWLSHVEAAAVGLVGLTAIWAIEDTGQLKRGETILIQGGAGGVAGFAIQMAHHLGARVITTASAGNHDYVAGLGADEVIDYARQDFSESVRDCDMVFDTVGGDVQVRSYKVLKPGGRLVFIAAAPAGFQPPRSDVRVERPAVTRDRGHLERILAWLEHGAVKPPPVRRFRLSDAAEAHRISEGRHLRGKLVFEIRAA